MQIDPRGTIIGYPALKIRKLLSVLMNAHQIDAELIADQLNVTNKEAARVFASLISAGLLEPAPVEWGPWRTTIQGNALANASAATSLLRTSADKRLSDFLTRVEQITHDPEWLYEVDKVVLFGSYLGAKTRINDIDLAVSLKSRLDITSEAFSKKRELRVTKSGRHFSSYLDVLGWPQREVFLFLKSGSRSIAICDLEENQPLVEAGPHSTLYENGRVVIGSIPLLAEWPIKK